MTAVGEAYKFNNVYDETLDNYLLSEFIYNIAEVRNVAKEKKEIFADPKDAEAIMKLPATMSELSEIVEKNQTALRKELGEDTLTDTLDNIKEIRSDRNTVNTKFVVRKISDHHARSELLHAIGVDREDKRVVVMFRGSATFTDFLVDIMFSMSDLPPPSNVKDLIEPVNKPKVHAGFMGYLEEKDDDEPEFNKIEIILRDVKEVLKKHPGCKLFITGHSLGGALSTIFSLIACREFDIPKPVSCISVASPFVGDNAFKETFKAYEAKGELRHLRVHNNGDTITAGFPFSLFPLRAYKHVGMSLRLSGDSCEILYPTDENAYTRLWQSSIICNCNPFKHFTSVYHANLLQENVKKELKGLKLDDLYAKKAGFTHSAEE